MKEITESEMLRKAAAYCSAAERCASEVRKKITSAGFPEDVAERIIARLSQERFIDESRYARFFAHDKFEFNKWGRIKLAYELQKRGIPAPAREEALASIDDERYRSVLLELLKSKIKSLKEKDGRTLFNKLFRFAAGKGFENAIIFDSLQDLLKDQEEQPYADFME